MKRCMFVLGVVLAMGVARADGSANDRCHTAAVLLAQAGGSEEARPEARPARLAAGAKADDVRAAAVRAIRDFQQKSLRAMQTGDHAAVAKHFANDFVSQGGSAPLASRPEILASLKSGELKYEALEASEDQVHVYDGGRTAVVVGRGNVKGQFRGKDISGPFKYVTVYVKDPNWKAILTAVDCQ